MKIKALTISLAFASILSLNAAELELTSTTNTEVVKLQEKDKQASFPGGKEELAKWLRENMDYPSDMKRFGTVTIDFIVKKNGKLTDFAIRKGVDEDLDVIAIEILRGMPKWEPAIKDGKAVDSKVQLPVKFVPKKEEGGLSE
ncbi:MAG: energy transducer TonB [Flavobacteriales bacterium]|nr:energy transducer TonB [Flavobacteriales bacterium]